MNNFGQLDRKQIVIFSLDEPRYALYLFDVQRVVRAVEIMPLPKAPQYFLGIVNVQGQVIPAVDIRQCFGLPAHEVGPQDRFILVHTTSRLVALVADSVQGIHELTDGELVPERQSLHGTEYIRSIAKLKGGLVLICDLEQILSPEEQKKLDEALAGIDMKTGDEA